MGMVPRALAIVSLLAGVFLAAGANSAQFLSPEPNRESADRGEDIRVSLVYESDKGGLPLAGALMYDPTKVEFVRFRTGEALNVDHDASTGKLVISSALGTRISGGRVPKKIMSVDFRVRDDANYGTAVFRTSVRSSSGGVIDGRYIDSQPGVALERFLP